MVGRLVLAAVAAPALALVSAPHAVAADSAGPGSGADCSFAGSIAPTPGVTYAPGQVVYTMQGAVDCQSIESGASHGTVTGKANGTRSCFGGLSDATMAIAWDNGRSSTLHVTFGDLAYGRGGYGAVDTGEFRGDSVAVALEQRTGGGEVKCAVGRVSSYEFGGEMTIGGMTAHSG
jgi:hypothetical protein